MAKELKKAVNEIEEVFQETYKREGNKPRKNQVNITSDDRSSHDATPIVLDRKLLIIKKMKRCSSLQEIGQVDSIQYQFC